jgi:hypothetical protein
LDTDILAYFAQQFDTIKWIVGVIFSLILIIDGVKVWRDFKQEERITTNILEKFHTNWGKVLDNYLAEQDTRHSRQLNEWGETLVNVKNGLCERMMTNEKVLLDVAKIAKANGEQINELSETLARHIEEGVTGCGSR